MSDKDKEYDRCLQCGVEKPLSELILCDDCMDNFDRVQQEVLQQQLDAIKKGIPDD
jgi:hypothetical protein